MRTLVINERIILCYGKKNKAKRNEPHTDWAMLISRQQNRADVNESLNQRKYTYNRVKCLRARAYIFSEHTPVIQRLRGKKASTFYVAERNETVIFLFANDSPSSTSLSVAHIFLLVAWAYVHGCVKDIAKIICVHMWIFRFAHRDDIACAVYALSILIAIVVSPFW